MMFDDNFYLVYFEYLNFLLLDIQEIRILFLSFEKSNNELLLVLRVVFEFIYKEYIYFAFNLVTHGFFYFS